MLPWDNRVRLTWFCVCVCVLELICACIPDLHLDSDLNMSSTCISSCVGDRNLVKRYFEEKKRNHIASRYNTSLFRCYKTTGWVLTKLHDENRGELEQQEEREWCRTALAQEDMGRLLTSEGFFLQSVIYPFTLCCISVALQWKSPFSPKHITTFLPCSAHLTITPTESKLAHLTDGKLNSRQLDFTGLKTWYSRNNETD